MMNVEERKRIIDEEVYIAEDGTVFYSRSECNKYEKKLYRKKMMETVEIFEMPYTVPINADSSPNEDGNYYWFKIKSKEDLETISKVLGEDVMDVISSVNFPITFPEIICVEHYDVVNHSENYVYTLTQMENVTKEYFERLGIRVKFEPIEK